MRLAAGAAVFAAAIMLCTGSSVTSAIAAPRHVPTVTKTDGSSATELSARRRHHRYFRHVRHYQPTLGFYHRSYYRPYHGPYYRRYPVLANYRPFYRPYYWPYYRPWYAYYRPAYYDSPYYYPYYGRRTFVSNGPFAVGFGAVF
jgi:hypothetical protein